MVSILEKEFDIKGYAQRISKTAVHDANLETARKLLAMGLSCEQILEATSLPLSEVTALQAELTQTALQAENTAATQ